MESFSLLKSEQNNLPTDVFQQVSQLINEYITSHPGEMLTKTPDAIAETYHNGNSVIAVHPENPDLVLGYAALYPFGLEKYFSEKLLELGSWIVRPNFRHHRINGLTLGEYLAQELIKDIKDPIIATVKRFNTLRAFQRLGFSPIKFQDYPCISSLTCVCPTSSEHHGFQSCQHRSINPGEIINSQNQNEPPKIACTLMGYNLEQLNSLEQGLQQQLGLIGHGLNHRFFQLARQKFESLGVSIL
ncbi:MAG: hypothetical protein Fur009_2570 [Candidatus Microgenomates bacterium]